MTPDIPMDPALPQLGIALRESAIAGVFADTLRGRGLQIEACRIDRIKYRPRRNCTLSYVLRLRDDRGVFEQRVAARLAGGGDSARRAAKAAAHAWTSSAAGPTWLHVASLDMLTHWWPNDAVLTATRTLADDATLEATVLPQVAAALRADTPHGHRIEIAQYVPEQRVCARVRLGTSDGCGTAAEHVLYAKADRAARGGYAHELLRALEQSPAARSGRLRTPHSLLWQPAHSLHWQQALPGRALLDLAPTVAANAAAAVGAQLAALHATPAPIGSACRPDALRRAPRDVAAVLGQVDPQWQPALARLADALANGVASLVDEDVTLHGDLHPRNVLVDGAKFMFIDLDGARRGPAVLDLGSWTADALYRTLLDGGDPAGATAPLQAFIAGYADGCGVLPDERTLAWATAYQLLCQRAWRCVVNLKPGRFALAPRLIALAEAVLRGAVVPSAAEVA